MDGKLSGQWEGDTLVVETEGFNDKVVYREAADNLHATERFTLVDANTLYYESHHRGFHHMDETLDVRIVPTAGRESTTDTRVCMPRGQLRDEKHLECRQGRARHGCEGSHRREVNPWR